MQDENQPDPIPNEHTAVWDLVIQDIRERDVAGVKEYGTRLQPFNGRNSLVDAYYESMDQTAYLRQKIEEERIEAEQAKPDPNDGVERFLTMAQDWLETEPDYTHVRTLRRLIKYLLGPKGKDIYVASRPVDYAAADRMAKAPEVSYEQHKPVIVSKEVKASDLSQAVAHLKKRNTDLAVWLRRQYAPDPPETDDSYLPTLEQAKQLFMVERHTRKDQAAEIRELKACIAHMKPRELSEVTLSRLKNILCDLGVNLVGLNANAMVNSILTEVNRLRETEIKHNTLRARLELVMKASVCLTSRQSTSVACGKRSCIHCMLTRIHRGQDPYA